MSSPIDRRSFLARTAAAAGGLGLAAGCDERPPEAPPRAPEPPDAEEPEAPRRDYNPDKNPNVILIRFGGGVRRLETVLHPDRTYCPFILHELAEKQGVLFRDVRISDDPGVVTSHGQGTLYLLTGRYGHYEDITHQPFAERFEAQVPTLFEYFRKAYTIPEHQALIVNGEDRINEEFYTFSNHHLFGVRYRATVLSLYRFKTYLLREELKRDDMPDRERAEKEKKLGEMANKDYRVKDLHVASPELDRFWEDWRDYYGKTGLVNPRGDRVLTALALRALQRLRPRLLMINYQDPDYVHWGNPTFYTRAISIIDEGVRELYHAVQGDEFYRGRTVFLVVPDCGRDNNRAMDVPFQHHFNTRSSREIFAVLAGPEQFVPRAARPDTRRREQIHVAATVGGLMGFTPRLADKTSLLD